MKSNDWKEVNCVEVNRADVKAGVRIAGPTGDPMVLSIVSGELVQGSIVHSAKSTERASSDTMDQAVIERVHGMYLQASVPRIPNHERHDAGFDKPKQIWQLLRTTLTL